MTDIPERIWAWRERGGTFYAEDCGEGRSFVKAAAPCVKWQGEYVRADVAEKRVAELESQNARLRAVVEAARNVAGVGGCAEPLDCHLCSALIEALAAPDSGDRA